MNEDEILKTKLEEIVSFLVEIRESLGLIGPEQLSDQWMDIEDVCFALKISKRTLQYYRNCRIIGFSQIAGKIYFKRSDVYELLQKNYKKALR